MRVIEFITRKLNQDIANTERLIPKKDIHNEVVEILEDKTDAENQRSLHLNERKRREKHLDSHSNMTERLMAHNNPI